MDKLHGGIVLPKKLTGTSANINKIVKYYQFPVFYERELALWDENPMYDGVPLRIFLYYNRLKYLGKNPKQLSDLEIMRGFKIAGILRGYTVFNTKGMSEVLEKYDVKSVYDPCAGWGERLLCCFYHDVKYHGIDVNEKLLDGYADMILDYQAQDTCMVYRGDSSNVDVSDVDADMVFTCPPYYNIEIYSPYGAENMDYQSFLDWWDKVVKCSLAVNPRWFSFQINQKYKQDMLNIVLNNGFVLEEEIALKKQSSHFTRKPGANRKSEYESVLVCKRV